MHTHHVDINRYIQTTEGAHSILIWIVIGLIAGYLTGRIMRGAGFGPIVDIIVGIVGAIAGGFIMISIGYAGAGGFLYTIFVAVIGAVLLTLLLRLVTGGRACNF
ncbi:MAG TPA: GlsB/YeaQ/YmgE family stress response membrane protein [Acidobacteriaceae bacterium]